MRLSLITLSIIFLVAMFIFTTPIIVSAELSKDAIDDGVSGLMKDLEYLIELAKEGPPEAVVENIEVKWEDYKGEFKEFSIAF